MIEHKRIKAICAVVLAAFVAVGTAVPCFASEATDDNGNWLPSSFYAAWYIWDTDSSSYVSATVTSSVTRDGLTFTFPYNTYGVSFVGFNLYASSAFDLSSVYIDGSITYASDLTSTTYPVTFSASNSYFLYGSESTRVYIQQNDLSNPFTWTFSNDSGYNDVSSFIMNFRFNPTLIDGVLTISFDHFLFNDEDISPLITVQNLEDAGDDLLDLADNLAVPTPAIDVDSIVDDALSDADMDSVGDVWSFMSNDLITKMLLIVVSFALLGYILYGKKDAGN